MFFHNIFCTGFQQRVTIVKRLYVFQLNILVE